MELLAIYLPPSECLVLPEPDQIKAAGIINVLALQHRFAWLLPAICLRADDPEESQPPRYPAAQSTVPCYRTNGNCLINRECLTCMTTNQ